MQKTLCTHVSRLGVTLNNFLGKQTHAFREREGLYSAFRQHPSRYIRLDKVTSHCNDALGVQLVELRVIHLAVGPLVFGEGSGAGLVGDRAEPITFGGLM
jgi:hypothetical protein